MLSPLVAAPTIHHEAIDWATRASANGGLISTNTIRAVSAFCRDIDSAQIRDRFARLSLMCGGNLPSALVPLYRSFTHGGVAIGSATDTNFNFVSSDYLETGLSGGLLGNGVSKYLRTQVSVNNIGSTNNIHLAFSGIGVETGTNSYNTNGGRKCLIGMYDATAGLAALIFAAGETGRVAAVGGAVNMQGTSTATEPLIIASRFSAASEKLYQRRNVASSINATNTTPSSTVPFAVFGIGSSAAASEFSAARCQAYSIGLSFTDAQAAAYYDALLAFRVALGRA